MSGITVVKDPVCGMEVETPNAAEHAGQIYSYCSSNGQTYSFCSSTCKEKFDENPAEYLDKQEGKPKSGCCG
jgi:YHS domain-containing protein